MGSAAAMGHGGHGARSGCWGRAIQFRGAVGALGARFAGAAGGLRARFWGSGGHGAELWGAGGGRRQVLPFVEAGAKLWGAAGPRARFSGAEGGMEQGFGVLEVYAAQSYGAVESSAARF